MVERIDKIDKIVRSNRPSFSFQPLDCYCNYKVRTEIYRMDLGVSQSWILYLGYDNPAATFTQLCHRREIQSPN